MKLYIKNMVCPRCVSAVEKSLQNIGVAPIDVVDDRRAFCIGLEYTLPMLITADARLDTKGRLRFQLGREDVPVSARLRFSFMINTDKELYGRAALCSY